MRVMVQGSAITCTALHMLEHVGASWVMNFLCIQLLKAAFKGYRCRLDKEARLKWFVQQLRLLCAKGMIFSGCISEGGWAPPHLLCSIYPYPALLVCIYSALLSYIIFLSSRG